MVEPRNISDDFVQNREIPDSCYLSGKSPCPRQQGQAQAHPSDRICRRIPCFFLEKEERGQRLCRCPRTFAAIGIMTGTASHAGFAKMAIFCYTGDQWDYREEMVYGIYRRKTEQPGQRDTIIQLFLAQQEQLRQIDQNLQLVLEQLADQKRRRFGRSSEKHETEGQIAFMEVDGTIVFFNEAGGGSLQKALMTAWKSSPAEAEKEAWETGRRPEGAPGRCGRTFHGGKGAGATVRGRAGWKQLPDESIPQGTVLPRQRWR